METKTLGQFVAYRRMLIGLDQIDVARHLGLEHSSWVSRLEKDRLVHLPDPDTITRLAEILESTNEDLLRAAGYLSEPDKKWSSEGKVLTPEQERLIREITEQFQATEDE